MAKMIPACDAAYESRAAKEANRLGWVNKIKRSADLAEPSVVIALVLIVCQANTY